MAPRATLDALCNVSRVLSPPCRTISEARAAVLARGAFSGAALSPLTACGDGSGVGLNRVAASPPNPLSPAGEEERTPCADDWAELSLSRDGSLFASGLPHSGQNMAGSRIATPQNLHR